MSRLNLRLSYPSSETRRTGRTPGPAFARQFWATPDLAWRDSWHAGSVKLLTHCRRSVTRSRVVGSLPLLEGASCWPRLVADCVLEVDLFRSYFEGQALRTGRGSSRPPSRCDCVLREQRLPLLLAASLKGCIRKYFWASLRPRPRLLLPARVTPSRRVDPLARRLQCILLNVYPNMCCSTSEYSSKSSSTSNSSRSSKRRLLVPRDCTGYRSTLVLRLDCRTRVDQGHRSTQAQKHRSKSMPATFTPPRPQ